MIEVEDGPTFTPNEQVLIEISGVSHRLICKGTFTNELPGVLIFENHSPPKVADTTEPVRGKVRQVSYEITWEEQLYRGKVHDISNEGIGIDCPINIPVGSKIRIAISGMKGNIEATIEVRHSAAVHQKRFASRLGARIHFDDRVSQARWKSLVEQHLARG
jgi:hypothetical protein